MKYSGKFIFLLLFGILQYEESHAQVVFTSSDLALPGSVLTYGITETDETFLDIGENIQYDFSSLSSFIETTVAYHSPEDFPSSDLFADVNLVMTNSLTIGPNAYQNIIYTQLSENNWMFLGEQFIEDPEPFIYNNPQPNLVFPLAPGLNESIGYSFTETYFFGQEEMDSLRSVLTVTTDFVCNSWGQLILPDATYDVILLNKNQETIDSSFSLSNGEWVFSGLNVQDYFTYEFYSPQAHCMVMRIEETEGFKGQTVWSVTYLKNSVITQQRNQLAESFVMYPNPAQDRVNIQVANSEHHCFELLDLAGKVVVSGKLNSGIIDIKDVRSGMYLMHIKDMRLNKSRFKRLIIEK